MKFAVPDAIVKTTQMCPFAMACQQDATNGDFPKCLVRYSVGENVLMVQPKEPCLCSYLMDYGNGKVCSCPTRYAIYRKYQM